MKISDFYKVRELRDALAHAGDVLAAIQTCPDETVPCFAERHYDGNRHAVVQLLPIPKSQAVSAAKRAYDKVVVQLAELGVTVEE